MEIKVMSWNMAGAKLFAKLDSKPNLAAKSYINAYKDVWENKIQHFLSLNPNRPEYPEIILLQECIGFIDTREEPSGRWQNGADILQEIYPEYKCFFFPALSSLKNPHPAKWNKYKKGKAKGDYLPDEIEAQQGYGICVRNPDNLRKIWITDELKKEADKPEKNNYQLCFEATNTTTGLYLGDRDTEPRLAILGRMKVGTNGRDERYLNFLNVHLATIKGERRGNIRLNKIASSYRTQQLDLILDNVISAYQETDTNRIARTSNTRREDIWIIGGDFNSTPDSAEISLVKRAGFVDGNPDKKLIDTNQDSSYHNEIGTKWSLADRDLPLTILDYIFCGLERTTFPTGKIEVSNSRRPLRPEFTDNRFETDHAVLFASFKI